MWWDGVVCPIRNPSDERTAGCDRRAALQPRQRSAGDPRIAAHAVLPRISSGLRGRPVERRDRSDRPAICRPGSPDCVCPQPPPSGDDRQLATGVLPGAGAQSGGPVLCVGQRPRCVAPAVAARARRCARSASRGGAGLPAKPANRVRWEAHRQAVLGVRDVGNRRRTGPVQTGHARHVGRQHDLWVGPSRCHSARGRVSARAGAGPALADGTVPRRAVCTSARGPVVPALVRTDLQFAATASRVLPERSSALRVCAVVGQSRNRADLVSWRARGTGAPHHSMGRSPAWIPVSAVGRVAPLPAGAEGVPHRTVRACDVPQADLRPGSQRVPRGQTPKPV